MSVAAVALSGACSSDEDGSIGDTASTASDTADTASDTTVTVDTLVAADTATSNDATEGTEADGAEATSPGDTSTGTTSADIAVEVSDTALNPETSVAPVTQVSETDTQEADSGETTVRRAKLVFAGDLDNNEGCADHGTEDHCNLFRATIDLETGAISDVAQLTDTAQSESYPAWNPSGAEVYFTILKSQTDKDIGAVNVATGTTSTILAHAAWPTVSPLGDFALYVTNPKGIIMKVPVVAGSPTWGSGTPLTGSEGQQDPNVSHLGTAVVFHDTSSGTATGKVFDLGTGQIAAYSDRSGHCTFGGGSDLTLCDNVSAGGLVRSDYANGALGPVSLYVPDATAAALSAFDAEFEQCDGASFNYPTFCGDDQHLFVSTSCSQLQRGGPTVIFSRLFMIDLTEATPRYVPIGKALAEAFAGVGKSTWTVDCLPE